MPGAAIAPCMRGNTLAAMEHLNRALGDACVDLLADERVRTE